MEMRKPLVALAILFLSGSAIGQSSEPEGFGALQAALNAANPFNPGTLLNRQFTITMPGAKAENGLAITPAEAFSVERQSTNTFIVKIVNPDALVRLGTIRKFKEVTFTLTQSGIISTGADIEGRAFCAYQLTFRQKGGGADFNLASLEPEYDIAFEESGPGKLATRTRTDSGLSVQRLPGEQGKIDIRMVLKPKDNSETLVSNWVSVPSCAGPQAPPVTQQPTTRTAGSCMQKQTIQMSTCTDNCGALTLTLKQRFENVCTGRQVRCDGMQWRSVAGSNVYGQSANDYWVQLGGGEIADFDVSLPAPLGSFNITGPNLESRCRFI